MQQDSPPAPEKTRTRLPLGAPIALLATLALIGALMLWQPAALYLWLKALHVVAVIAWMAGLLYLPRLFVYHCEAEPGSRQSETFKLMERRLLHAIMAPAMVVTWVVGLWLAYDAGWFTAHWLQAKLVLVFVLSGLHGFFQRCVDDFAADRNRHSQRFFRMVNEVPTLLMIAIIILVIVKPF